MQSARRGKDARPALTSAAHRARARAPSGIVSAATASATTVRSTERIRTAHSSSEGSSTTKGVRPCSATLEPLPSPCAGSPTARAQVIERRHFFRGPPVRGQRDDGVCIPGGSRCAGPVRAGVARPEQKLPYVVLVSSRRWSSGNDSVVLRAHATAERAAAEFCEGDGGVLWVVLAAHGRSRRPRRASKTSPPACSLRLHDETPSGSRGSRERIGSVGERAGQPGPASRAERAGRYHVVVSFMESVSTPLPAEDAEQLIVLAHGVCERAGIEQVVCTRSKPWTSCLSRMDRAGPRACSEAAGSVLAISGARLRPTGCPPRVRHAAPAGLSRNCSRCTPGP